MIPLTNHDSSEVAVRSLESTQTYVYRRFILQIARRDLCLPWTIQWNPMG